MKNSSKLFIILVLAAFLVAACSSGEPANELDAIKDAGKVVMGTSADYPPFESYNDAGEMVGFDVDLMYEIGKRMGVDVKIQDMPFSSLIAAVQEGKIDMSVAAINYTEERDKTVDFSTVYYYAEDGFLVAESFTDEITKPEDAAKYLVAVQTGSTADGWAIENLVNAGLMPEENLFRYERIDQAALDVKSGRIDLLITDYIPAQVLADDIGGLKVVFHAEVSTGPVNIIVPEGAAELKAELDRIINEMLEDGFIDGLATKHIGQ